MLRLKLIRVSKKGPWWLGDTRCQVSTARLTSFSGNRPDMRRCHRGNPTIWMIKLGALDSRYIAVSYDVISIQHSCYNGRTLITIFLSWSQVRTSSVFWKGTLAFRRSFCLALQGLINMMAWWQIGNESLSIIWRLTRSSAFRLNKAQRLVCFC